jgi:pheromone shutdown protein TraB
MKCFFHNDRDATAICQDCGRCLCPECIPRLPKVSCVDCLIRRNDSARKQIYSSLATAIIIFTVVIFMLTDLKVSKNMILDYSLSWKLALSASFTYFGWKFLSGRKNYIFIGNLSFWFFYIFTKLAFSFVVGLFVGPLSIYQMIREILHLNKIPGLQTITGMRVNSGRFQNR